MSLLRSPYPSVALDNVSFNDTPDQGQYDYIIVGAGTAGCVLARRLSDDPYVKVLLLERGNARLGWSTQVPLLSTNFMGNNEAAYRWPSTPAENLTNNRSLNLVTCTGKGLRGGSAINSMQYTRGYPQEYDMWSDNGRKGWSFSEIEGYFKKSEQFIGVPERKHHGTDGEWVVRDMGVRYFQSARACADACTSLGLPFIEDLNDPDAPFNACAKFDCTIDASGHRSSTFTAFLPQNVVEERKSRLHICTGAMVSSLDLERDGDNSLVVKGVGFQSSLASPDARVYRAIARREVILCAGPIASPQVLLLSGIGPANRVQKPLMKELPGVGANLQDHLALGIMYNVPTAESLHIMQKSRLRAITELFRYIVFGEGLLLAPVTQISILVDSASIDDSGNIVKSQAHNKGSSGLPDLEILPVHFNYSDPPVPFTDGVFSFKVGLMRPASRGSVLLASNNPLDRPVCDLAFLSDPADLAVLRKGIKLAKRIGEKMREQGMNLKDLYMPDSESDAELDAFVRKTARTTYHYGCTCRMAPEDDARPGVVDDELRVHGVKNLWIADTSVIPDMMSAHLQAPAVMIAEKCADMVKATYLRP